MPACFLVVTTPFLLHSCKPEQELSGSHFCSGSALAVSLPAVHCFSIMSSLSFCRLCTSFSFLSELHKHLYNLKLQPNLVLLFCYLQIQLRNARERGMGSSPKMAWGNKYFAFDPVGYISFFLNETYFSPCDCPQTSDNAKLNLGTAVFLPTQVIFLLFYILKFCC